MIGSLTRRALWRVAGAAALVPAAGKLTGKPYLGPESPQRGIPAAAGPMSNPVPEHVYEEFFAEERRQRAPDVYRVDGFEPAIAAMRSWSPAFKAQVQAVRDLERESVIKRLRETMFGPFRRAAAGLLGR